MDPVILDAILQTQRLAYMLASRELRIASVQGGENLGPHKFQLTPGASLLDSLPELSACAAQLDAVLAGTLPSLKLAPIIRPHADGGTAYFSLNISAYHSPGAPAQLLVQLADTTKHGRQQHQLSQWGKDLRTLTDELEEQHVALHLRKDELRRVAQLRVNFVTIAAHELRNPLTPVLAYIELLLDEECGPLTLEQRATLETLLSNVLRLRTTTTDLLDLVKIEMGRVELVLYPTDLQTLVELVCMRYRPQLAIQHQQLDLQIDAVPLALCDETRAAQIIGLLLSNACKYTPPHGQIRVRVRPGDDGFVMVTIQDTGIGIGAGDQPHLFDAFFRARAARGNGTGLSLHLARLLVELHGGQIWVQSESGQGATFCLTFLASGSLVDQTHAPTTLTA